MLKLFKCCIFCANNWKVQVDLKIVQKTKSNAKYNINMLKLYIWNSIFKSLCIIISVHISNQYDKQIKLQILL